MRFRSNGITSRQIYPPPFNHSSTLVRDNPSDRKDLAPVFPMNLIEQEVSTQRWIDIPEGVMEKLLIWRPTPLHRAYAFEKALGTPARIYYKNEGVSPQGVTNPIQPLPRPITIKSSGLNGSQPRQALDNGEVPSASPAASMAWSARSIW